MFSFRKTFKCKRNTNCLPPPPLLPSSMDLYFTQKFRRENSNGKQCQSVSTVCPHPTHPQIPTHCTSVVNRTQNVGFSFDLNNAGMFLSSIVDFEVFSPSHFWIGISYSSLSSSEEISFLSNFIIKLMVTVCYNSNHLWEPKQVWTMFFWLNAPIDA